MKRFIEGEDREQGVLLPEYLEDYVSDENPVRIIDVFVDELGLGALARSRGSAGVSLSVMRSEDIRAIERNQNRCWRRSP